MKSKMLKHVVTCGVLMSLVMGVSAEVKVDVDWPAYMAQQDQYTKRLPKLWDDAPFLGNGVMGALIFLEDEDSLIIQMGRGDVQEHRAQSGKHAMNNKLPDSSRFPTEG